MSARMLGRSLRLAGQGLLWATPALAALLVIGQAAQAAPEATGLSLSPAQRQALGLRTVVAQAGAQAATGYPAMVVLPPGGQRVVSVALPALVEGLRVSVGDVVRAGQVLAVLRSPQAQELQRDRLTAGSQAELAASALARDEQLHAEGLIPLSRLETSRAQARQAQAQADERRRALAATGAQGDGLITLTAPISGVVVERSAAVGQRVEPAVGLLRIAAMAPLWLELQLPAADAAVVQLGDAVQLAEPAAQARVIAVGAVVDATSQTVLVRAELRSPPPGLRAGQAVQAMLSRRGDGLVRLPAAAVLADGVQRSVFIEQPAGRFRLQPVQPVAATATEVTVKGLTDGTSVVVQGIAALKAMRADAPAAALPGSVPDKASGARLTKP